MSSHDKHTGHDDEFIVHTDFTPLNNSNFGEAKKFSPKKLAIGTVLMLLVLLLLFLFSATSVDIHPTPANAELDIDGGLALPINGRYLMTRGSYRLTASADGYFNQTIDFTVTDDESNRVEVALAVKPGFLLLTTTPAGAKVYINGIEQGLSPLSKLELNAGKHQLALYAPRHRPITTSIDIQGMNIVQQQNYSLTPAWAMVSINSLPGRAEVLLDGESIGHTPLRSEILEGTHQLALRSPGYKELLTELSISAGNNRDLGTFELQREDGLLRLQTYPNAARVLLNGVYQGNAPLLVPLSPLKNHQLTILKPGYHNQEKTIRVESQLVRDMTIKLEPKIATVRIIVQPAATEILIDGKTYPYLENTLELPAHEHKLEVRKSGYQAHIQTFTPKQGLDQLITVQLRTLEQARVEALKPLLTTSIGHTLKLFSPGSFTMGASRREPGRRANEILRPVKLDRLFYLSTHEVSNEQFLKFQPDHQSGQVEGNSLGGDKQPVVKVSWELAAQYCNWLSRKDGLEPFYTFSEGKPTTSNHKSTGYRLPTEAEWAWAARSQSQSPQLLKFPWGKSLPPPNHSGNYADKNSAFITRRAISNYVDKFVVTAPVGSFASNSRGLYDMGGNVAEWTNDYYGIPSSSGKLILNPTGPEEGDFRVIRGASWADSTVTELRLSYRNYGNEAKDAVGFRLARYAE